MDDFLLRALLAGAGVALMAGPLGCFVVWRRMAYFGDTMAHGALLGVALALAVGAPPLVGVLVLALVLSVGLSVLARRRWLSLDTVLGVFAHGALALGLTAVAVMATRIDLLGLLLGDVLAVSWRDVALIGGGVVGVLTVLAVAWRGLLATTLDPDLAQAEGVPTRLLDMVLMGLIAGVVALAMKVVGVLLVTALMVIPAAAARPWARSPESMAVLASVLGLVAVAGGLGVSMAADTPAGPSMVVVALGLFVGGSLGVAGMDQLRQWINKTS
ncbi:metal ABC transporter permease [Pararhodospirillum oryzae]|uniref:High-affinity zinc uptake system membrane protein ZnuB n=1 Tax=Pararhodospirillum oryzae TaxID=478448 RepID=A0A512HBA0_9PROT|nr:metal ABC transporter permease [Pararhodospirillum oryzae]GEO82737.1 membrane protein [Pararhodospirillum oryzae]